MPQYGDIPQDVKRQVHQVINLILEKGIQYEDQLTNSTPLQYSFLTPKSKYYRYYTNQLYQHGPTSRQRNRTSTKQPKAQPQIVKIEGTIQTMSVGAMVEIIKNDLNENKRQYYEPFQNYIYDERMTIAIDDQKIKTNANNILEKYHHLFQSKKNKASLKAEKEKEKQKQKKESKFEQMRKEIGTNKDGSLGAFGGNKYEGLGVRDQFDTFRREKSQNYYMNFQEKSNK